MTWRGEGERRRKEGRGRERKRERERDGGREGKLTVSRNFKVNCVCYPNFNWMIIIV